MYMRPRQDAYERNAAVLEGKEIEEGADRTYEDHESLNTRLLGGLRVRGWPIALAPSAVTRVRRPRRRLIPRTPRSKPRSTGRRALASITSTTDSYSAYRSRSTATSCGSSPTETLTRTLRVAGSTVANTCSFLDPTNRDREGERLLGEPAGRQQYKPERCSGENHCVHDRVPPF